MTGVQTCALPICVSVKVNVKPKYYLSYGGGVNSTALLLLVEDWGWDVDIVYVDHACDWPETREYVDNLIRAGHKINVDRKSVV